MVDAKKLCEVFDDEIEMGRGSRFIDLNLFYEASDALQREAEFGGKYYGLDVPAYELCEAFIQMLEGIFYEV